MCVCAKKELEKREAWSAKEESSSETSAATVS
jgi:hypothetical protein